MGDIKKMESKLHNLQNDIDLLQKKINLSDSERRTSSVNNKSDLKKNSLEIKQLRMQIQEMQVRLKKKQINDCKLMENALHEKFRKFDDYKGKSSQEILQMVESNVLELNNKNQTLSHRLQVLERSLLENNKILKEMTEILKESDIPSESDCLQQKRHLQNEQYRIIKCIEKCEKEREMMKVMVNHLQKKQKSHAFLLMDLKKEKRKMMKCEDENMNEDKICKDERRTIGTENGFEKLKNEDESCKNKGDLCMKEKEFEKLKNEIFSIRDATGCYNIHDIDSAFLKQRTIKEDLTTMIKQADMRLQELKEEKKYLYTKRSLMKETSSTDPESEQCMALAKNRKKEQELRRESSKTELEKLDYVSSQTKEIILRMIMKMQPKINKDEVKNMDIKHLLKQLEKAVKYTFPYKKYSINSVRNSKGSNSEN